MPNHDRFECQTVIDSDAILHQDGLGLPRNRIQAYAWYSLAATENAKDAVDALNALEALLRPDEIKAAQKLAREWSLRIAQEQNEVTP